MLVEARAILAFQQCAVFVVVDVNAMCVVIMREEGSCDAVTSFVAVVSGSGSVPPGIGGVLRSRMRLNTLLSQSASRRDPAMSECAFVGRLFRSSSFVVTFERVALVLEG